MFYIHYRWPLSPLEAEKQISDTKDKISLHLVLERDKEHLKVIHTNSKLESLKSSYRLLNRKYDDKSMIVWRLQVVVSGVVRMQK